MAQEQQRLTPTERGNLVAYLDGELNEAESRAIATKLSLSPTARREADQLEKTWNLLDHLPKPRASEGLTERTLTGCHQIDAAGGRLENAFAATGARLSRALIWVGASVAAFAISYAAALWLWPNPTERLARNLSVAEHLDEYREVGDLDYLKQLVDSSLFNAESDE